MKKKVNVADRLKHVTARNTTGLIDALFMEFDMLRNGESDAHRASAVAKLAIQIIGVKRLEIEASALIKGGLNIRPLLLERGIKLGREA